MRWRSASEARMCCFSQVELVLLGATNRLVRLDEGNRLTEVRASRGHHGPGGEHRRLGRGGCKPGWVTSQMRKEAGLGSAPTPAAGANSTRRTRRRDRRPRLVPSAAGRIRRRGASTDLAVVVRPNGRTPSLAIEGSDPLPTLDKVVVTVQVTIRAGEGAQVEPALNDVVDAAGRCSARSTDERSRMTSPGRPCASNGACTTHRLTIASRSASWMYAIGTGSKSVSYACTSASCRDGRDG